MCSSLLASATGIVSSDTYREVGPVISRLKDWKCTKLWPTTWPTTRNTWMPSLHTRRRPDESELVGYLESELARRGKQVWIDRSSIEPGSDWRDRILRGIRSCRAYVYVITPQSAASSECRRELEVAELENKKVIPVVLRDVPNDQLPEALTRQNWISFADRERWDQMLDVLIDALDTDVEWRDMHTRLLMRAEEWISSNGDHSFLLRGRDLESAEDWYEQIGSHRERPTDDQVAYIAASRRAVSRRLRIVAIAVGCGLAVSLLATVIAVVQRHRR